MQAKTFFCLWLLGIIKPSTAFDELRRKPAPLWGFWAIVVRFVITSLTTILALHLLNRQPFVEPYLTFLPVDQYYAAEVFFLPVFGLAGWLLSGALVHLILRLTGKQNSIDWILNVIGWGLLVVMPVVWLLDWVSIGLGVFGVGVIPAIHAIISIWEVVLMGVGLSKLEDVGFWSGCLLGLIVKGGIYIPLALIFVR